MSFVSLYKLDRLAGFVSRANVLLVASVATDLRLAKHQQLSADVAIANTMLHTCVSPGSNLCAICHILQQSADCVQHVVP